MKHRNVIERAFTFVEDSILFFQFLVLPKVDEGLNQGHGPQYLSPEVFEQRPSPTLISIVQDVIQREHNSPIKLSTSKLKGS